MTQQTAAETNTLCGSIDTQSRQPQDRQRVRGHASTLSGARKLISLEASHGDRRKANDVFAQQGDIGHR